MTVNYSSVDKLVVAADSAREGGRYQRAKVLYAQAAAKHVSLEAEAGISSIGSLWYISQQYGVCQARQGWHELAIKTYDMALSQLASSLGSEEMPAKSVELAEARVLRDRADSKVSLGQLDSALEDLETSTTAFRRHEAIDDLVSNEHFMGRLERKRGGFKAEGEHLIEAFELMAQGFGLGDKLYLYLDYASWLVRFGDARLARSFAREVLAIAIKKRSIAHIVRALRLYVWAKRPERIKTALYGRS